MTERPSADVEETTDAGPPAELRRLASVGFLASGLARELSDPLAAVAGNLAQLEEELTSHGAARIETLRWLDLVKDTQRRAELARGVSGELEALGEVKKGDTGARASDLGRAIDRAGLILAPELRGATLVKRHGAVPRVVGSEAVLSQVLVQLLRVTMGASEGGTLSIATSSLADGRVLAEITRAAPQERRAHDALDAKSLVLDLARDVLAAFGGELELAPGDVRGVSVLLRAAPASGKPASARAAISQAAPRARVLIIDDDAMVARSLRRMLSSEHDVTLALGGPGALARLRSGERFDVVFCDLMMPELTGMELHAELERTHPEIARGLIFITGSAFTAKAKSFLDRVPNERLDKPIDPHVFRAAVRSRVR